MADKKKGQNIIEDAVLTVGVKKFSLTKEGAEIEGITITLGLGEIDVSGLEKGINEILKGMSTPDAGTPPPFSSETEFKA